MAHAATALHAPSHVAGSPILPDRLGQNLTPPSWHPKITPYRLIVLTTTTGLGTAKAVLTQRGSTVASITLEWLLATAVFLLLFCVSAYDSREDVPQCLSWLFSPDCMSLAWSVLTAFSIPRPPYVSQERLTISNSSGKHPPITSYRILVCFAVTSFGMSKALLGYFGLSTSVAWTDWALAVPSTSCLYILGLYEYNSLNVWSSFFVADRSEIFYSVGFGLKNTVSAILSTAWTIGWGYVLWYQCHHLSWNVKTDDRADRKISWRTLIEEWSPVGYTLFFMQCIFVAIASGVIVTLLVLRSILRDVASSGGLESVVRVLRQQAGWLTRRVVSPLAEESIQTRRSWLFFSRYRTWRIFDLINSLGRLLVHIISHLFFIMGCCSFTLMFSQLLLFLYDLFASEQESLVVRIILYYFCAFVLISTALFMFTALTITLFMLSPFLLWFCDPQPLNDILAARN